MNRAFLRHTLHIMAQATPGHRPHRVALRKVNFDLHAQGEACGEPGAHVTLVLPEDWRDVPHSRSDPPFWVLPWPSGSALAALLLKDPGLVSGKRCIDVGCGVAPAGLAAARAGASHVLLADRDRCALQCALQGAEANDVAGTCSSHALDWRQALEPELAGSFDVALACDLFYEEENLTLLSRLLPKLLRPKGTALVGLPVESEYRPATDRAAETCLRLLQREAGFALESLVEVRGAQLSSSSGPEGLAAARRVVVAKLRLHASMTNASDR